MRKKLRNSSFEELSHVDPNQAKKENLLWSVSDNIIEIISLKSDKLKWKPYAPRYAFEVEALDKMWKEEIERRIGLATVLEEYGIKTLDFDDFEWHLWGIEWTEELKSKLDQLKWKQYAPEFAFEVEALDKMWKEEIERRIGLATALEEYGIKILDFDDFGDLWEIEWTEELKSKLDQLKWKPNAPEFVFQVVDLQKIL